MHGDNSDYVETKTKEVYNLIVEEMNKKVLMY